MNWLLIIFYVSGLTLGISITARWFFWRAGKTNDAMLEFIALCIRILRNWSEVKTLIQNIRTQDNRITAHPVFIIQERERDFGVDREYWDCGYILVNKDDIECNHEDEKEAIEWHKENGDDYNEDDYRKVYYLDRWEFVTACLTEAGCEEHIRINGHNLGVTRIYVSSGHRNPEWQLLRKLFGG